MLQPRVDVFIGRLWVPQDYSSRGRALERRRYTCADVARVKWLLVQGRAA